MGNRDKSCAERIEEQYQDRHEQMSDALAACQDSDEGYDTEAIGEQGESIDGLRESVLSVEVVRHVRITLSTGGPADGFDIVIDEDGEVVSGTYWFQDWFDGATRPLAADELALVEEIYGPFYELDS